MIEINLLPLDLRQAEGTPLPRLISILSGALVFTLGCVLLANYYFVDIPRTESLIKDNEKKKAELLLVKAEVDKLNDEIAKIKEKVAALRVLYASRIRWWRVLECFSRGIPEGCVMRNFRVSPEGGAPTENSGRRYRLDFQGFATGDTYSDCVKKVTDLRQNLEKVFEVGVGVELVNVPGGNPAPAAPLKLPPGFSNYTKLRFDKPVIIRYPPVGGLPELDVPAADRKRYPPAAKAGLDYTMFMTFSLLPPPTQ